MFNQYNTDAELEKYFNILCNNQYPKFIDKYIKTSEMERLANIGQFCGMDYTKLYSVKYWYSRLHHSIACALMTYNFTHDKTQTLCALFHDLGTPAFSHCIDYLLNDPINQESSEKDVFEIIKNSDDIRKYLDEDGVNVDDLKDISKYTIVENKKPKLCVDRLDGILTTCLIWIHTKSIEDIKNVYENITVIKNNDNEAELGFKNVESAESFFNLVYEYSIELQKNEDKYTMNFISDYLKKNIIDKNLLKLDDFYEMAEKELLEVIRSQNDDEWIKFESAENLVRSDERPENKYFVSMECKKRYVNPVCEYSGQTYRLDQISENCKELLDNYFAFNDSKYCYLD